MSVLLRKAGGGADSFGHTWKTSNSVVEVTDGEAAELLHIKDAGFSVVTEPVDEDEVTEPEPNTDEVTEPEPPVDDTPVAEPAPDAPDVTEPAPAEPAPVEAPAKPTGRARKATQPTAK